MPKIIVVPTPLGNLSDFSERTKLALIEADVWFVEDTRVSIKLQSILGVKKPMKTVNEHSQDDQLRSILRDLGDQTAAILSDAGTPCISDPGARLIDLAYEEEIEVEGLPGPSAVPLALSLSGFYAQRYAFLGFLGRKAGAIRSELEPFKDSPYTLVFFESPFRIDALIEVAGEVLGPRRYAVCRELTKIHEQVVRGTLPNRPTLKEMPRKGEITFVIEGRRKSRETKD